MAELASKDESTFTATIVFNNDHKILGGHFPNNPIIPGACIVEICTELLSLFKDKPLVLSESKKTKFTNSINPLAYNKVDFCFTLSEEAEKIKSTIMVQSGDLVFARISAVFKPSL